MAGDGRRVLFLLGDFGRPSPGGSRPRESKQQCGFKTIGGVKPPFSSGSSALMKPLIKWNAKLRGRTGHTAGGWSAMAAVSLYQLWAYAIWQWGPRPRQQAWNKDVDSSNEAFGLSGSYPCLNAPFSSPQSFKVWKSKKSRKTMALIAGQCYAALVAV